jgi:hypothetical protein
VQHPIGEIIVASQLLAILAAGGLVSAGVAATETRSAAVLPLAGAMLAQGAGGAEKCRVDVVRTGSPGSADITRANLPQGGCVCTITTGPAGSANGSAESLVTALLRDRECENAPAPGDIGRAASGAAGGGGGSGALIGVLVAAGVAGGLAAGLGGDSRG